MAKKGQTFNTYSDEFKLKAVMKYVNGSKSYKALAEEMGIRNCSQLKVWVEKWKQGVPFDVRKDVSNPLKGRPRTTFKSEFGRERITDELNEMGIQSIIRKKRKRHGQSPSVFFPNRLKRNFKAMGPQQKMVTDITYVSVEKNFIIYLLSRIFSIMK
ncbi:Helix-turn-helix domain-containing protein [Bacillus sp. OV322]|uniref:transposase n=1 Tax=Bacillus sp. OV322 TaxID=1882764 RepID=UPI0008EDC9D3|nr:Helix-turn-helix domain-containing protein [Bacillus sp. OV322]